MFILGSINSSIGTKSSSTIVIISCSAVSLSFSSN
jgi:hypothetical protein